MRTFLVLALASVMGLSVAASAQQVPALDDEAQWRLTEQQLIDKIDVQQLVPVLIGISRAEENEEHHRLAEAALQLIACRRSQAYLDGHLSPEESVACRQLLLGVLTEYGQERQPHAPRLPRLEQAPGLPAAPGAERFRQSRGGSHV
jgi:hypothetical protein